MKNETSFKEGNGWRFSKDCQPKRRMTSKQILRAIDDILSMNKIEIDDMVFECEAPLFLRSAAKRIKDGDLKYVAELRSEYANSIGLKQGNK